MPDMTARERATKAIIEAHGDLAIYVERALNAHARTAAERMRERAAVACEKQRQKIIANPNDPSWTEHLAESQMAIRSLPLEEE